MGFVEEKGGQPSSSLNSLLRSSEGLFLLTVLEGEEGERSLLSGVDGTALPLGDGGFVSLREASEVIVMDIWYEEDEEIRGVEVGYRNGETVGRTIENACDYIPRRVVPLSISL